MGLDSALLFILQRGNRRAARHRLSRGAPPAFKFGKGMLTRVPLRVYRPPIASLRALELYQKVALG